MNIYKHGIPAILVTLLCSVTAYAVVVALVENSRQESLHRAERERVRLNGMRTGILIEQCRSYCSAWDFEFTVLVQPDIDNLIGYVLPLGPGGSDQCVCVLESATISLQPEGEP